MIAEMIVVPLAIPRLPRNIDRANTPNDLIPTNSINMKNNMTDTILRDKQSTILKSNFPKYTDAWLDEILSRKLVWRSSSLTKLLESPVIAPKKRITHSKPAVSSELTLVVVMLKAIITIVVSINNDMAEMLYLVRNSLLISFRNTARNLFSV
jgi:hypothetical protein